MSKGTPPGLLPGEKIAVNVSINSDSEAAAFLYPFDYNGVPVRCALTLSNYRVIIRPAEEDDNDNDGVTDEGNHQSLSLPLMSIASWGVPHRKVAHSCSAAHWHGRNKKKSSC